MIDTAVHARKDASPMAAAGEIAALSFTARKESWIASSEGRFYKIFRRSDDPAQDWLDSLCIDKARREFADMLLLHRLCRRVCCPLRRDHACVVYPYLAGPDMRELLRRRGTSYAQRTAALREAMTLLAALHAAPGEALDYPLKDYLHDGYLVPGRDVVRRIAGRERTLFIGGFEARNFRFDRDRGGWCFFDPQHVYLGMPEDDVARFVISLLMINWGSGGSLKVWQRFDAAQLLSGYETASGRRLDRTLLNYFLHETVAMRRHFAEKALRGMPGAKRVLGRPYLGLYFRQLEKWVANHEF